MMVDIFYDMIFKRKSVRRFDESLTLSGEELRDIEHQIALLTPLRDGIETKIEIVPRGQTTSRFGEYCLLLYSEVKEHYLLNAGYLLEQMDLYLASKDIGACWYGIGKPKKSNSGLKYIIMMAFGKSRPDDFRKDPTEARRNELSVIWQGEPGLDIAQVVRYAPSSCNTQPWRVRCDSQGIHVFRATHIRSIMPPSVTPFFNTIDMGIFLFFLETSLSHQGYSFERRLHPEDGATAEQIPVASYFLPAG